MNLNVTFDGLPGSLRQTSSQISYMCIVQPDGAIPGILTGKKAKHALEIYLQWIRYSLNGVWESEEELRSANAGVKEHIESVRGMIHSSKKIEVWVM